MTSRFVFAIAAALPLVLSSSARAEEAPAPAPAAALAAPTPAPAAALAAPTPAPAETGRVEPAAAQEAARQLSWGGIGVRLGYFPLKAKAKEVPMVGSEVMKYRKDANAYIATFNGMVQQWNQAHPEQQVPEVKPFGEDALDLEANLLQVIPTFHLGGDDYFFRFDVPIGFGDGVTSLGLGIYPLNYGYFIESIGLFPYVSLGTVLNVATASTYDGPSGKADVSQVGGIIQARAAVGAKYAFSDAFSGTLELGFTPWGIAGLVDTDKAEKIAKQGGPAPEDVIDFEKLRPIDPGTAGRAGMISPAVDFSAGIEWL